MIWVQSGSDLYVSVQSHYSPFLVNAFVVQYFMIVVAPVFIAAAFYLSLSYAIRLSPGRRKLLPIGPKGLFVFICFDAVTTIIQIAGAALIGTTESARVEGKASSLTPEDANHILLAGLAAQVLTTRFAFRFNADMLLNL